MFNVRNTQDGGGSGTAHVRPANVTLPKAVVGRGRRAGAADVERYAGRWWVGAGVGPVNVKGAILAALLWSSLSFAADRISGVF